MEPSQESLIEQLSDDQLAHLPLVISSGSMWGRLDSSVSLPRRARLYQSGDNRTSCAEYLYNTFTFDTQKRLKRFNREIAQKLERWGSVHPVMLVDPSSRTLTIGMPSHIGLESPQRGKEHVDKIVALLDRFRLHGRSTEEKKKIARQLRSHVIPNGFRGAYHAFGIYVFDLYDRVKKMPIEEVETSFTSAANGGGRLEQSVRGDAGSESRNVAQRAFNNRSRERRRDGKSENRPARATDDSPRGKKGNLAARLSPDDPRLPEAGTFVASDGDVHKPEKGVDALQDHVPFPKPSAEEMGIKRPTEATGSKTPETLSPDDPKLPEAGTFVAQDGDAHKPSKGVDALQEHVPFPTPSAGEMGIKKPTDSRSSGSAETWSADDPKLPEAGTFVAQDGDAHKPSEGVDSLQEHVPFPKPTADEMGIKKPTES